MPRARLPSATASISVRGPNAASPPANTPGRPVARVVRSTSMSPASVRRKPVVPPR